MKSLRTKRRDHEPRDTSILNTFRSSGSVTTFENERRVFRVGFVLISFALLSVTLVTQAAQSALRELPFDFHPGDLIQVRIQVTPPAGTTNWTVREFYPDRWNFVSSTNASSTNEFTGELQFGPFSNAVAQTLSYEVASIQGLTNSVCFSGTISFNGATNSVAGTTNLPARNEWLFVGPQTLDALTTISGVAYGAGRWLASSLGWVTTLEPGGRLTYPRGPVGRPFYGDGKSRLAYLGGLFLMFGGSPDYPARMAVSDDGLSWKAATSEAGDIRPDPFNGAGFIESVAYGNGAYVAVGSHYYPEDPFVKGSIFRSTNGFHWRRVFQLPAASYPSTRNISAVAFAQGRFIAVADRGTLITSTNGSDWTEIQPIQVAGDIGDTNSIWMSRSLRGICHGPSGWIIPTSVSGTALRSTDGGAWTELTGTGSGTGPYWQSFYADGKYWFSGYTTADTTVNGSSWTRPSPLSPSHPVGPVSRAPDGVTPQYLGAGVAYGSSLVSSTNGSDWTVTVPGIFSSRWPRYLCVASFSNEWVVTPQATSPVGVAGREYPSDRPPYVWIPILRPVLPTIRGSSGQWRKGGEIITYADLLPTANGFLAAGANNNELRADHLSGTNWDVTVSTVLPALNRGVPAQYWKYVGPYYIGGAWLNANVVKTPTGFDLYAERYSYEDDNRIRWGHFTSTNGMDWSRRSTGLNHATNFPGIRGLAWGAGRFVAVSEGSSPGSSGLLTSLNRIYTSTDGENYSPVDLSGLVSSLNGEGLTGVAYASGRFVAIGNAGRILSSSNGLDWETVRPTDGHRWNRVRYLDGTWAVVGNSGWVAFSTDGQNWTSKTSGTESDLNDIARQNGSYMVVGSHATVLVSLPVLPPIILADSLGRSEDGSVHFTVQTRPDSLPTVEASTDLVTWTVISLPHSLLNATGRVTFTDNTAASQAQRFFRVRLP